MQCLAVLKFSITCWPEAMVRCSQHMERFNSQLSMWWSNECLLRALQEHDKDDTYKFGTSWGFISVNTRACFCAEVPKELHQKQASLLWGAAWLQICWLEWGLDKTMWLYNKGWKSSLPCADWAEYSSHPPSLHFTNACQAPNSINFFRAEADALHWTAILACICIEAGLCFKFRR